MAERASSTHTTRLVIDLVLKPRHDVHFSQLVRINSGRLHPDMTDVDTIHRDIYTGRRLYLRNRYIESKANRF